ncbi:hypothetical protein PFTANZ_05910, partial [Plasmodium falciparum Tanzania (2000708)]
DEITIQDNLERDRIIVKDTFKKEEIKSQDNLKREEIKQKDILKENEVKKIDPLKKEESKPTDLLKKEETKPKDPLKKEEVKPSDTLKKEVKPPDTLKKEVKPTNTLKKEEAKPTDLLKEERKTKDTLKKVAEQKGGLTTLDKIKINTVKNKFKIRIPYKNSKVIESEINDILNAEYEDADEDLTKKYRMKELMSLYFEDMDYFHQSDIYKVIEKYSKQKEYSSIMTPMFKDFMETHRISSKLSKTMMVTLGLIVILTITLGIVGIAAGSSIATFSTALYVMVGVCAFFSLSFPGLLFARAKKTKAFIEKYFKIKGIEYNKTNVNNINSFQGVVKNIWNRKNSTKFNSNEKTVNEKSHQKNISGKTPPTNITSKAPQNNVQNKPRQNIQNQHEKNVQSKAPQQNIQNRAPQKNKQNNTPVQNTISKSQVQNRVNKSPVQNDYSKHNGRGPNQMNRPNPNRHVAQPLR